MYIKKISVVVKKLDTWDNNNFVLAIFMSILWRVIVSLICYIHWTQKNIYSANNVVVGLECSV